MKSSRFIIISLFFIILGLIVLNITVNNMMSTQGIVLNQIQTKLHDLQNKNIVLEDKVLALSSYSRIASQAATMGFVQDSAKTQIALSDSVPLADSQ